MVLQRQKPVVIWGTAEPRETVTVEFAGQTKTGRSNESGKWRLTLDPMPASSEPRSMIIRFSVGNQRSAINNVLVGEVWFAGGQSNMRWPLWNSDGAAELFASGGAEVDGLRLFAMPEIINELDADLRIKGWQASAKESSTAFSAIAWYFGRDLRAALGDVPVGLIMSARGGTPAEAWMDPEFANDCKLFREYADSIDQEYRARFSSFDDYKEAYLQYREDWKAFVHKKSMVKPEEPKGPWWSQRAGGLYSTMIVPLLPYSVRGVLWYQGETNMWRAYDYRFVLETLIRNWRRDFNDATLPFLVVQLPGFSCGNAEHPIWAELRDSQAVVAEKDPNVGLIPIPELGDEKDIHPRNKRPVGERLARYALGRVYGEDILFRGPSVDSVDFRNGRAIITLKDAVGLSPKGEGVVGFTIAGEDERFVPATAELDGDRMVVSSPEVNEPVAVRYLWSNWIDPAQVRIFNEAGLPLAPFRTDDFNVVTQRDTGG
jgi:sialate O-acetylesterase